MRSEFDSLPSVKIDERSILYSLDKELVLSCAYIHPSHSRYVTEEHFSDLDNFLSTHTNDDYVHVLCGDFNAHTLKGRFTHISDVSVPRPLSASVSVKKISLL